MSNIFITKQSPEDVEAVNEVYYKTWMATYPNEEAGITSEDIDHAFMDDFSKVFIAKEKERIAKLSADKRPLIAEDGEVIVGICTTTNTADKNALETIYVLPEYQGQGVGSMLWKEAKKQLDDVRDITLTVTAYNKKTIQFYEKLGFVTLGDIYNDTRLVFKSGATFPSLKMVLRPQK